MAEMLRSDSAVVLFTLAPRAEGERKRLGLSRADRAAAVFATLIDHLKSVCRSLPGVDFVVSSPGGVGGLGQRGRSFGESLKLAVEDAFALGYRRVVVIGNDVPEITTEYLARAFAELSRVGARAVLGPAMDGGYNLLGLSKPCATAFEGIPWGTADVAGLTERALLEAGYIVSRLEPLADIDTRTALDRFLRRALADRASVRKLALRVRALIAPLVPIAVPRVVPSTRLDFRLSPPLRAPPAPAR